MSIIGTLPNTIANGDPLDAVPVMADFNWIVSQVNGNAAPLASPAFTGAVSVTGTLAVSGVSTLAEVYSQHASGTAPDATPINIFSALTSGARYLVDIGSSDNNVRCLYYVFYNGATVGFVALDTGNFTISFSGAQCRIVNGSGSSQSYDATILRIG